MTFQTIEAEPFPFPGTLAARKHGCICPDAQRNQGSFNNPPDLELHAVAFGIPVYVAVEAQQKFEGMLLPPAYVHIMT